MDAIRKYQRFKERADELNNEILRAEVRLEEVRKKLKEEFDCDDLEEARSKLTYMKGVLIGAEKDLDKRMEAFESYFLRKHET